MINIFLDSNLLFRDPLMQKGKKRELFQKVQEKNGNIFICDVVYKEVLHNYKVDLEDTNEKIEKIKDNIDKIGIEYNIEKIDVDRKVKSLDKKIKEYIDSGKYKYLTTNNDILPEVIDRSINRKKPFSEKKQEFRDCIIWLTYSAKAEKDNLENCVFISNNTSDFCQGKNNLHPDLIKDSNRFKFYKSIEDFFADTDILNNNDELDDKKIEDLENFKIKKESFEQKETFEKICYAVKDYFIERPRKVMTMFAFSSKQCIDLKEIEIKSIEKKRNNIQNKDIYELGDMIVEVNADLKTKVEDTYIPFYSINTRLQLSYIAICEIEDKENFKICDEIKEIIIRDIQIKEYF